MRKFLIVLVAVTMVAFLFGGCFLEPNDDEDEPGEPGICPVVNVTSEVAVEGKNYIKGGKQTITVAFAVPTEPVSVYVGYGLKANNGYNPGEEVVMYPNEDKTVYTGDFVFGTREENRCGEAYIYVETCETCAYCKYPYTVDTIGPYASIKITIEECACPDYSYLKFDSAWTGDGDGCEPLGGCCGDECSGLASWAIDIYDEDPYGDCCDVNPCTKVLYSSEGTACPVLWTTDCTDEWFAIIAAETKEFFAIIELKDVVGNSTKYYALMTHATVPGFEIQEGELSPICEWEWESADDGIIGGVCP